MITYEKQKSITKPKEIEITENKVFIYEDICEFSEILDEENEFHGYTFKMTEYAKDEYLSLSIEKNSTTEKELTATQLALCEIYERML